VAPSQRGRVLGSLNSACFLGQLVSPFVVAPFLERGMGLDEVFVQSGVLSVVIALTVAFLMPRFLEEEKS